MTGDRGAALSWPQAWAALDAELGQWQAAGKVARFWWRDDDATKATPALNRLVTLRKTVDVPLTLAVIPAQLAPSLVDLVAAANGITAAQHGFSHANHAPATEKKSEFPASRSLDERLRDLRTGQAILRQRLGEKFQPVLVPPWNRFAPDLLGTLPSLGFSAISAFQLRRQYWAAEGLAQLNTHMDPVDWRGGDSDLGCRMALMAAIQALTAIRTGLAHLQPVGLLTHHLRHDSAGWDFIETFLRRIAAHPAARWVDLAAALAVGRPVGDIIQAS
ncbi:MAG TPA: polysaccharide deacetylase family protein [Ferrovibrio sp.]|jgi:hypothetical protein|uniref:polysaccharide deacetylase family protein n=1 Tax=Ferrovibrio sp. TaxID=1917215 RepID=UPI002ED520BC